MHPNTPPKEIETSRLLLRQMIPADAKEIQRLAGAFEIYKTTLNMPHPYMDGMAEIFIDSCQQKFKEDILYAYAITDKITGQLYGCISLTNEARDRKGEIGYWIGKSYWNLGFASESLAAILKMAFVRSSFNRVFAKYMMNNPASGRVMEKCGMKLEGVLRQEIWKDGSFHDIGICSILKEEYKNQEESLTVMDQN